MTMDGDRFTGNAMLFFKTAEAAQEAAELGATVGGETLWTKWRGVHVPLLSIAWGFCEFCRARFCE